VARANQSFRRAKGRLSAEQSRPKARSELYRLLSRSFREILLFLDAQGRILEANAGAVAAYGYDRDSLLSLSIRDLEPSAAAADAAPATRWTSTHEAIHRRRDGTTFTAEVSCDGDVLDGKSVVAAVVRPAGGEERSPMRALDTEQRYRIVADNTYDWEYWASPDGRVLYSSPSCERITGYSPEEIESDPSLLDRMVLPEDRPAFEAHRAEMLSNPTAGVHCEIEFRIAQPGGPLRWIGHVCGPVRGETGEFLGVRGSNRDITERKQVEAEREALAKQLEQKNAELEKFTYTVSHDLKSPLITIKGFLGLVEQDLAKGDAVQLKSDMARIGSAADKMKQLLDDLLQLSRIGRISNPPEEVSLSALAREALDLLAGPIAERGVSVAISPDLPNVLVERPRFLQVLENLIDNAVAFMGDQPEPRIEIGSQRREGELVCFIADNGVGIDPRYHAKVFGLFEKLDQKSKGTGVGLAIVKRIVEIHGGRIWVESEGLGKGSRFCFTVPAKDRPGTAREGTT
jgi:chemotaxis family two-component system sensor kinase Cph1